MNETAQQWRKEQVYEHNFMGDFTGEHWDILTGEGNDERLVAQVSEEADADRILHDREELVALRAEGPWTLHEEGDDDVWAECEGVKAQYITDDLVAVLNAREATIANLRDQIAALTQERDEPNRGTAARRKRRKRVIAAEKELIAAGTLLDELAAALDNFARGPHRRQFPHVKPDAREQAADALLARYAALIKEKE